MSRISEVPFHSESSVTNFHEPNTVALELNVGPSMFTIKRLHSTGQYIRKTKLVSSYKKKIEKIIGVTYQADELLCQISAWKSPSALAWVLILYVSVHSGPELL
jgi:hypothetical protein